MVSQQTPSLWQRFWEHGGWWRALLLTAAYFVLYQAGSLLFLPFADSVGGPDSALYILVIIGLPILLGGLILVAFALSVGWLRELFRRQPIRGRGWMWAAVAVVLVFNILRLATVDYGTAGFDVAAAWLLTGLFIGFAEEVLTRGLVVNLLRRAGHREIIVAVGSAALFAAMHAGNLLTGQSLFATAFQLVYTFAFGICMYLTLRVTGNLVWPILLHASTDASLFLQTAHPADTAMAGVASMGNIPVIILGIIFLFFIRGRVEAPAFSGGLNGGKVLS